MGQFVSEKNATGVEGEELVRLRGQLENLQLRLTELESPAQPEGRRSDSVCGTGTPSSSETLDGPVTPYVWSAACSEAGCAADTGEELDDSIRQYMERLLQSLGDCSSQPAETAGVREDSLPRQRSVADGWWASKPAADEPSDRRALPAPLQQVPEVSMPPRSTSSPTTETPADMGALRELADVAAKTAHLEFQSRQHARQAVDKLLVTLICLPCGLLLLYWSFAQRLTLAYTASGLALFAAACWGAQALRCVGKLAVGRLLLARLWHEYGRRP